MLIVAPKQMVTRLDLRSSLERALDGLGFVGLRV